MVGLSTCGVSPSVELKIEGVTVPLQTSVPLRMFGNVGSDTRNGGNGPDSLNGGSGTDKCRGNAGTDGATACEVKSSIP